MGSSVQPSRFLDGENSNLVNERSKQMAAILGLFAMLVSALSLYMFGELWNVAQDQRFSSWRVGFILQKLFPFKRTFDVNLTHILLFTIAVLMLSLRPEAPPALEETAPSRRREKATRVETEEVPSAAPAAAATHKSSRR
ncbi:hypothetical protein, conserved [Eimeria acervulina]|uniref:Uncharacterized protein n=1 Tax=Eimeria acervulina TaxID=5801 RepID=U6GDK1_EIMAC|nr:hypothetical protein, conserved [Eimeria acervulina]CDI78346.1 hypothetical protein, conserved [Eimeria acervulina]